MMSLRALFKYHQKRFDKMPREEVGVSIIHLIVLCHYYVTVSKAHCVRYKNSTYLIILVITVQ